MEEIEVEMTYERDVPRKIRVKIEVVE